MTESCRQAAWRSQPASDRIIVALDCAPDEAIRLADILQGKAKWLKVGMTLFYQAGPAMVKLLKDKGFKVFLDLKLHDIPHQVRGAALAAAQAGADLMTVHASGGLAMMAAAVEGARSCAGNGEDAVSVIAVTVLTSSSQDDLERLGVARPMDCQVSELAAQALQSGLDGVVCSPLEAAKLRALFGEDALIVTPGVRPLGSDVGDQQRVATPSRAFEDGASHIVVGRPITQAPDPLVAFESIVDELKINA